MHTHSLGQNKASQKEHDNGIGKGGKGFFDSSNSEDCNQDRHKKSRDGNGNTFCDPPDNDPEKNCQKAVSFRIFLQKRREISCEYATKLRKQLKEKGVRSFGSKKENDYYLKQDGFQVRKKKR